MKRITILLLGLIILIFAGCYNFNNPVDTGSENYQGYPADPPPDAPSDLAAVYMGSYIRLDWTDNSDNETGFKIERKFEPSGHFEQIYTVESDVTTYDDSSADIQTGYSYTYRVRAYNTYGDSAYSNEASATIP
jgi:uncharacterized protein YxeA